MLDDSCKDDAVDRKSQLGRHQNQHHYYHSDDVISIGAATDLVIAFRLASWHYDTCPLLWGFGSELRIKALGILGFRV